jgi:hypothetical protein
MQSILTCRLYIYPTHIGRINTTNILCAQKVFLRAHLQGLVATHLFMIVPDYSSPVYLYVCNVLLKPLLKLDRRHYWFSSIQYV